MQEAGNILKKYWGHESFRPMQEEIILAAEKRRDILALLPTGGGKSLCFQLPVLMREGIGIVISPLVALMEDQVKALQKKGIKALAITGGIPFRELDALLDNCIYGNYKFLYLSPERLQQDIVQQRIKQMNINLIAIDEAHCISQWGHDFRPAYLNICLLRELKPEVPFMALTASATAEVVKDVQKQLELRDPVVCKTSLERTNIAYRVIQAEDKMYRLQQTLRSRDESAIVYVRTRNATIDVARELLHYGYTAAAFHGGLAKKEKTRRLDSWLQEDVKVMVATSAFGMGIDKPNVRHVIHLNLPESIESYFQEAGRAGRDEQPATATIITNKSDLPQLKNQFLKTLPDLEFTILVYKKLATYFRIAFGEGQDEEFDFNFSDFCTQYQLHSEKTYNTLQLLDRMSILKMSQQFRKAASVQFIISNRQLLNYLDENIRYDAVTKAILRTYGGIFENKMPINLSSIAKKAETREQEVITTLQQLEKDHIIDFDYQQNDASIVFLVPREDEAAIYPFSDYIRIQNKNKTGKIESLLEYIANDKECRSRQLLKYFGEPSPPACGICSVCLPPEREVARETIKRIYNEILGALQEGDRNSRELVALLPYPETGILKVLRLMLEKEIIVLTGTNAYKLNKK